MNDFPATDPAALSAEGSSRETGVPEFRLRKALEEMVRRRASDLHLKVGRNPVVRLHGELVEIKSPMVGTFYRAPAPEAPNYVEVGTRVSRGQTLCILEAMKLMNELECDVAGVVREICVDNAEPVEYGQVLFRIEPAE